MTIYEFCCRACSHRFEMLVLKDRDGRKPVCPACGRTDLDRKLVFPAPKCPRSVSSPSHYRPGKSGS